MDAMDYMETPCHLNLIWTASLLWITDEIYKVAIKNQTLFSFKMYLNKFFTTVNRTSFSKFPKFPIFFYQPQTLKVDEQDSKVFSSQLQNLHSHFLTIQNPPRDLRISTKESTIQWVSVDFELPKTKATFLAKYFAKRFSNNYFDSQKTCFRGMIHGWLIGIFFGK